MVQKCSKDQQNLQFDKFFKVEGVSGEEKPKKDIVAEKNQRKI